MARREMCANLGSPAAPLHCCKWVQYLTIFPSKSSGLVIKLTWRSSLFIASISLIGNFQRILYKSQDLYQGFLWKIKSQGKSHQPQKFPRSWDKTPSLATLPGSGQTKANCVIDQSNALFIFCTDCQSAHFFEKYELINP